MIKMAKATGKKAEVHIVKRRGHKENYDDKKVYASCYYACMSAHVPEKEAEKISKECMKKVNIWLGKKKQVTAHQIYKVTGKAIRKHDKNAAFMYETHMDVS
jgi:transcriptional regulator NrdR family protein